METPTNKAIRLELKILDLEEELELLKEEFYVAEGGNQLGPSLISIGLICCLIGLLNSMLLWIGLAATFLGYIIKPTQGSKYLREGLKEKREEINTLKRELISVKYDQTTV